MSQPEFLDLLKSLMGQSVVAVAVSRDEYEYYLRMSDGRLVEITAIATNVSTADVLFRTLIPVEEKRLAKGIRTQLGVAAITEGRT